MHGSPLIRALFLTAALAVLGLLLSRVAGDNSAAAPIQPTMADTPNIMVPAILSLQLSGKVESFTLTSLDGNLTILALNSPALESDQSLEIPMSHNSFTGLLSVTWATPANTNFLRILLEPEQLESRELLLHAPDNLAQHAIEFEWPAQ